MKDFFVWVLPQPSVKGSENKWIEADSVRAKNRKEAIKKLEGLYWKKEPIEGEKDKFRRINIVEWKLRLRSE